MSGLCVDYLELDRGESTQSSLSPPAVVGPLNPGHDLQPKFLPGLPPFLVQNVLLQEREERFHRRVICARADPAHRSGDSGLAQQLDEYPRTKLRSTIRMQRWGLLSVWLSR